MRVLAKGPEQVQMHLSDAQLSCTSESFMIALAKPIAFKTPCSLDRTCMKSSSKDA